MKIGIITFHRADNYGALLQVYALQKALTDFGHEVDIIDYRCDAIEKRYVYYPFPRLKKNIIEWFFDLAIVNSKMNLKRDKFNKFRNDFLKLTDSVKSDEDRKCIQDSYDFLITGSDQIWNKGITKGKDDWYCFKQTSNTRGKLISYGASVGNLNQFKDYFNEYGDDLEQYYRVSVREQDLAAFLNQSLPDKVFKAADPTLLLSETLWTDLITDSPSFVEGEYVFYYDVEMNPTSLAIAKELSSKKGIKCVHFNKYKIFHNGQLAEEAGPREFLHLIKNAKYVVTSSFHATIFSVIFKKQFFTMPHSSTSSRVRSFLDDVNLGSRLIESLDNFSIEQADQMIDFDNAKKMIKLEAEKSIEWLQSTLK